MGRKTVDVRQIVAWTNNYLASANTTPNARLGVASLCDQVLHATGNYAGFSYLESEYLPVEEQIDGKVLRDDFDESRRVYSTRKIGA